MAEIGRLYETAAETVAANYDDYQPQFRHLPLNMTVDLWHSMLKQGKLCQLSKEMADLDLFLRTVMYSTGRRNILYQCFQGLIDHGSNVAQSLARSYCKRAKKVGQSSDALSLAQHGQLLANFLYDSGQYVHCTTIAEEASAIAIAHQTDTKSKVLYFNLSVKLMATHNSYCRVEEGNKLFAELSGRIEELRASENLAEFNLSQCYAEFSTLFFMQSKYDEAYKWAMRALAALTPLTPLMTLLDVLRYTSKACVVKRLFKRAEMLIKQAMAHANRHVAALTDDVESSCDLHLKLAELYSDYGFYLLNVDLIARSVKFYQLSYDVRNKVFTGKVNPTQICNNLVVAVAGEDLAYASYVHEYSSGRFEVARNHAEKALAVMQACLPQQHLLLASAKRIKALILEEIAIDHHDKNQEMQMLQESQQLHISALDLAIKAFGKMNVQTAKHYGNLGRLYQSMQRFNEAEEMHLKAIEIKEQLLGPDDFEVALSLGHLASLYNYDMLLFDKAEELYLRSIKIGIKLFGEAYSGLEYDYRGLLRVYLNLGNHSKTNEYMQVMHRWKHLRDDFNSEVEDSNIIKSIASLEPILAKELYSSCTSIESS